MKTYLCFESYFVDDQPNSAAYIRTYGSLFNRRTIRELYVTLLMAVKGVAETKHFTNDNTTGKSVLV